MSSNPQNSGLLVLSAITCLALSGCLSRFTTPHSSLRPRVAAILPTDASVVRSQDAVGENTIARQGHDLAETDAVSAIRIENRGDSTPDNSAMIVQPRNAGQNSVAGARLLTPQFGHTRDVASQNPEQLAAGRPGRSPAIKNEPASPDTPQIIPGGRSAVGHIGG